MATSTTAGTGGERIDYAAILPHRTKLIILAGVLVSLFLAALDQTIVSTALPAIIRDFQGIDLVSWVSTAYLLASTATVPIYGKLSDLYGRKVILIWGIVVFLLGSIICGMAWNMISLILFRVIQGIGAAALTSTAFAIPADLFAPADRPKYMGMFGSVFGLASVVGPFLGGFLTDQLSWHWVFYVNLPLGLLALAFVILKMPRLASGVHAKIDWLGTVLLILAVVPLMLGLTLDKTVHPWGSPLILGLFATAIVATGLFLWVERRVSSPVISLDLFRNRTFAVGIAASVLNGAAFFGAVLFLSLFLVNVLGMTATGAGTAQIPLMVAFVFSSNLFSQIVQRVGRYKLFILLGFVLMVTGFFLLSQINVHTSVLDITWRMAVIGLGMGPALPLLNLALQNAVPFNQIGSATATRQFFQQLGQALGGAVFGVVLATTLTAQLAQNLQPVIAELPPALQQHVDPAQFRNGISTTEGSSGDKVDIETQIVSSMTESYANLRQQVTAALQDGDTQAREALLASSTTPDAVKTALNENSPNALPDALAAIDAQQQQSTQTAQHIAVQLTDAVKLSFATSITSIYFYAIFLGVAALLIVGLFLPELPLRKTNTSEPIPAFE